MSRDVTTLARALLAGDLTAVIPLIDELKIAGDEGRANLLRGQVGHLLADGTPSGHRIFVEVMQRLFWMEAEGRDDRLKDAALTYARRIQSPPQEECGGMGIPNAADVRSGVAFGPSSQGASMLHSRAISDEIHRFIPGRLLREPEDLSEGKEP